MPVEVPRYDELPLNETMGMRTSWGVFGADDEAGTVNHLGHDAYRRGAACIKTGAVHCLSLPLDLPDPPWTPRRTRYEHHVYFSKRNSQDDYIDNFQLQGSSQWDGLRHYRAREFGFYNGLTEQDAGAGGTRLGIDVWARRGIIGRGVLLDVAGYLAAQGTPIDPRAGVGIEASTLEAVAEAQGSPLEPGDILLVRTGYMQAYLAATPAERVGFAEQRDCPGLSAGEETARFLWDNMLAAVAADNPAVENVPGSREKGSLHQRLIPMLGFAIGEFFTFETLAAACAERGDYTCFFVSVPLNLPGGVGSPANAVAIV